MKLKQGLTGENRYAFFRQERSGIWIREFIGSDSDEADEVLKMIGNGTKGAVFRHDGT